MLTRGIFLGHSGQDKLGRALITVAVNITVWLRFCAGCVICFANLSWADWISFSSVFNISRFWNWKNKIFHSRKKRIHLGNEPRCMLSASKSGSLHQRPCWCGKQGPEKGFWYGQCAAGKVRFEPEAAGGGVMVLWNPVLGSHTFLSQSVALTRMCQCKAGRMLWLSKGKELPSLPGRAFTRVQHWIDHWQIQMIITAFTGSLLTASDVNRRVNWGKCTVALARTGKWS